MHAIAGAAAEEERRTRAEVARLSAEARIQVPANEVLFFPTLPLRVDTVKAKRGSAVSGSVMNVTSSRLVVDSSLSVSDPRLVHPGDPVVIEDQDLGVKAGGSVSVVAQTPGTNRVDPSRFYLAVRPGSGVRALVGASVKLTIAVKSTKGLVLAVPANALSVGGDGDSRVQVRRGPRRPWSRSSPASPRRASWRSARPSASRWLPGSSSSSARGAADGGRHGRVRRPLARRAAGRRRGHRAALRRADVRRRSPGVALRDVNLRLTHGTSLAIVGPSGSGKSTLLNILGCLDRPTSGTYLFDRIDVGGLTDDQRAALRAEGIGFVFQTFNLSRTAACSRT